MSFLEIGLDSRLRSDLYLNKPVEKSLLERVLEAVRAGKSFDFQSIEAGELTALLNGIVLDLKPEELDHLASILPLEKLEEATRIQYPEHESAIETVKAMVEEAKYYLSAIDSSLPFSLVDCLLSILDSLLSILESFLRAFGIADFFKAGESSLENDIKGQKIMMLLTFFTLLSGILIPLLGAELGAIIVGSTLLTIALLSLIYPYIKPAAKKLPRGENWSEQCRQGELFAAQGRKATLDEMARILIAGKQAKTHVMLLGKTGMGKTASAKAFVQAVERGDYPELKGKQIFYFNTAELLEGTEMLSNANKILAQISSEMGRHREDFILIFDEIHVACKSKQSGNLAEKLKTYLDPGKDKFPYVIGITTEEEYRREIDTQNGPFGRRFKPVVITNTNDLDTIKILHSVVLKQAPATILAENAMQTLLEKTKKAFGEAATQPAASLNILSKCLERTSTTQRSPLEARVEEARGRIEALHAKNAGQLPYGRREEDPTLEKQIQDLQTLENELETAKTELEQLFQDRDRLFEIKKTLLKRVVGAGEFNEEALSAENRRELNSFLLESHFQARLLEARIRRDAQKDHLKVQVAIDETLIDRVIAEEQASMQRAREAIERGEKLILDRKGLSLTPGVQDSAPLERKE